MKEITRRIKNLTFVNFVVALIAAVILTMILGVINNVFEMGITKPWAVVILLVTFVWCLWSACDKEPNRHPWQRL